jgi:PAS domain S-box-containing protein
MKKTLRERTTPNLGTGEHREPTEQNRLHDLELLLAQTSAALEKANRLLQAKTAEFIRMETECKLAADRYSTLLQNIPGAVYRCANDDAWTMEYISKQIENLSGYPAEEFLSNRIRTYASIIHPDDVMHVFEMVQESLNKKKPYVIEYKIKHKDGGVRFVWEKGQGIFNHEGELNYLDGVIFDITDRVGSFSDNNEHD